MDIFSELLRLAQVVLGIGLIIFVHELGHFLAARLCHVRVVTFSLGFGPRLLGWRRGRTTYQIAAVPLGGFCRMAGEDHRREDGPSAPDELPSKTVGQRFFIYSGGVLMNAAFALVVFPILFHVGMPFLSPVLGDPIPGGPAWQARVPAGARVLAVNDRRVLSFDHIGSEVALGDPRETVLRLEDPQRGEVREVRVKPEFQPELGYSTIGVLPPADMDAQGRVALEVRPDSPAERAGLRSGDRISAVEDGPPWLSLPDQLDWLRGEGGEICLIVADASGAREVRVAPELSTELGRPRVGIGPPRNLVVGVRPGVAGGASPEAIGLRVGDRLVSVAGRRILRLRDLEQALLGSADPVVFELLRDGERLSLQAPALSRAAALALCADLALAQDLETTVILPQPGEPASLAGLRDEDRILRIDGTPTREWKDVTPLVELAASEERACVFSLERIEPDGRRAYLELEVEPQALPFSDYGFAPRVDQYVYRAGNAVEALEVGAFCSWKSLQDVWLTLKRVILGQVEAEVAVGGPIQIGRLSYALAAQGWTTFFFFLCIVSVNLAFINLLPIPVLDGGHLFFLVIEKIKGSPVSERVLGYSQMIGVVLILSLMVFVTYTDLVRWISESR